MSIERASRVVKRTNAIVHLLWYHIREQWKPEKAVMPGNLKFEE